MPLSPSMYEIVDRQVAVLNSLAAATQAAWFQFQTLEGSFEGRAPMRNSKQRRNAPRVICAQAHAIAAGHYLLEVVGLDEAVVADLQLVAFVGPAVHNGERAGAATCVRPCTTTDIGPS